jgi:hypothetical protein
VKSSKLDPVTNFRKDVDYTISYGGFLIDYVIPVIDRLDFSVGVVIGGGNIDLAMRRDDGSFKDWNKIWNEYGRNDSTKNLTRRLNGDFFALTPNANLEYALLDWFQLRVGVAYPMFSSPDWKLDDQYEVISVPAGLKPDGPVIQAGIMFGFFN